MKRLILRRIARPLLTMALYRAARSPAAKRAFRKAFGKRGAGIFG